MESDFIDFVEQMGPDVRPHSFLNKGRKVVKTHD